MIIIGDYSA